MKFDVKYPQAQAWDEPMMDIIKTDKAEKCFECGAMTPWVNMTMDVSICSTECCTLALEEYNRK